MDHSKYIFAGMSGMCTGFGGLLIIESEILGVLGWPLLGTAVVFFLAAIDSILRSK